jgi:phosphoglycerate dehydrogenase-like enzyme
MIKVTAESFIKNRVLCAELITEFPSAIFWDRTISLQEFCADAEAVIVGREIIDEEFLSACPQLKIVSKYGVGLDNIDIPACEKRAVKIGWTPGVNKTSVAELTLAFMLGASHNIFKTGIALKEGRWQKKGGIQLSEKTVGIIGVGHVGKELIRFLQPFNCRILVNDIIDQPEYYYSNNLVESSKNGIYREADFISLHVPLTDKTNHLITKKELDLFKSTTYLINTCRGEVVNQNDLNEALANQKIVGAYLDVFETEPCTDIAFLSQPNLFATPHIGGNAWEAVLAMGRSAIQHISYFYKKES